MNPAACLACTGSVPVESSSTASPAATISANSDAHRPSWERLNDIPAYREAFQRAFGRKADERAETQAIATFCRTLLAGNAPFDRGVLNTRAKRGSELFFGKAACAGCHSGPNLTDEAFHDIGIGQEEPLKRFYPPDPDKADFPELGRFNVTHRGSDRGAFKTPTLRELESTGPYMHDGRFGCTILLRPISNPRRR